jgi:predicted  nucleic acid-binding Zn-ribbon protein
MRKICIHRGLAGFLAPVSGLLAVLLLAMAPTVWAQSSDEELADEELPDELQTGQVRFQLLVGEPLTAMALNPRPDTREQRLLHAQGLLDLGLYQAARKELEALASADSDISAQAGLELVRLALKTGDLEQTEYWLDETLPRLQGDKRQEGLFRQAELMRRQGDLAGAATVLGEMESGTWTGLGYFNLAASYAERDQAASRPLVALRVAAATTGGGETSASAELINRSHLGGGLLAMREENYPKAVSFFDKIHLDSYYAPRALYLHGLAQLKQNNVRGALQSWHRARKFPLAFPGTPQAYIAMGQGFDEAGSSGQAADAFLAAEAAFEKERIVLTELDENVQDQGGYAALILASRQRDVEWFLDNSQAVTAPRLAWLMRFMEAPEAQQAVRRLAELDRMDRRLQQKQADLKVIHDSLEDRLKDVRRVSGSGDKADSAIGRLQRRAEDLQERAEALQHRYDQAVADSRMDVLVSGELASRFQRLETLEAAARHHGDPSLQDRVRRLRGLTLWQAQDSFDRDRRSLEASLLEVKGQIDETRAALEQFGTRLESIPAQVEGFLTRVEEARDRVSRQRQRIAALHQRSDQALTEQVRDFIAEQKAQLELLADRSEQEIAHLYEYMAVTRLKADQRRQEAP